MFRQLYISCLIVYSLPVLISLVTSTLLFCILLYLLLIHSCIYPVRVMCLNTIAHALFHLTIQFSIYVYNGNLPPPVLVTGSEALTHTSTTLDTWQQHTKPKDEAYDVAVMTLMTTDYTRQTTHEANALFRPVRLDYCLSAGPVGRHVTKPGCGRNERITAFINSASIGYSLT